MQVARKIAAFDSALNSATIDNIFYNILAFAACAIIMREIEIDHVVLIQWHLSHDVPIVCVILRKQPTAVGLNCSRVTRTTGQTRPHYGLI